ncbi:hypothetical protein [Chryseobacterium sp. T1]
MKYIALLLTILSSVVYAQVDVEEQQQDSSVSLDASRNVMTFDVKGVYQLADNKCLPKDGHQFSSVKYATGEADFLQNLRKRINQSINADLYAADGSFYIDVTINRLGNVTDIVSGPAIPNTRYLYEDLKSAVKKVKGKWIPATCDGIAIDSKIRVKLAFDSLIIDNPQ